MVFDAKFQKIRDHFRIKSIDDWSEIRPAEVISLPDVGNATLNHLRLYLAARGKTLKNDGNPSDWQRILSSKFAATESDFRVVTLPFRIAIDIQEKIPFTFSGIRSDSEENRRPFEVITVEKCLGPHHGDYSIEDCESHVSVERKSADDALGTFLSHGERRDRWLETITTLSEMPTSAIVVECSLGKLIASIEPRGSRPREVLARTLHRQILAWSEDYRVPFHFCDDRRLAEITTFHVLRRAWEKLVTARKQRRMEADLDSIHDLI